LLPACCCYARSLPLTACTQPHRAAACHAPVHTHTFTHLHAPSAAHHHCCAHTFRLHTCRTTTGFPNTRFTVHGHAHWPHRYHTPRYHGFPNTGYVTTTTHTCYHSTHEFCPAAGFCHTPHCHLPAHLPTYLVRRTQAATRCGWLQHHPHLPVHYTTAYRISCLLHCAAALPLCRCAPPPAIQVRLTCCRAAAACLCTTATPRCA